MIIQATPYGTKKEEPFAFTYSGDFTDSRVDGIGDVTLNTSGQLVTTGKTVKVTVYILGAGGGGANSQASPLPIGYFASGGGGGYQTVEVELSPGAYEIIIGSGGAAATEGAGVAGGDTIAFGIISTGGSGGFASTAYQARQGGTGGTPNGGDGTGGTAKAETYAGGSPNGGSVVNSVAQPGGDGLVRITFS